MGQSKKDGVKGEMRKNCARAGTRDRILESRLAMRTGFAFGLFSLKTHDPLSEVEGGLFLLLLKLKVSEAFCIRNCLTSLQHK